jgi:hypothetical protein
MQDLHEGEGIPRDEEVVVHLVGLRRVVGCKRKNQTEKLESKTMDVVGSKWRLVSRSRFKWDLNLIWCLEEEFKNGESIKVVHHGG